MEQNSVTRRLGVSENRRKFRDHSLPDVNPVNRERLRVSRYFALGKIIFIQGFVSSF